MAGSGRGQPPPPEKVTLKEMMTKRKGKRWLYETGFICLVLSFIALFLSFATPYWIVSWPRVYSGFKSIGLWQVCLSGLTLAYDPSQAGYHGCWWIPATYFDPIRSWLLPPWFIYIQVAVTICFIVCGCAMIALFIIWFRTGGFQKDGEYRVRDPLILLQTSVVGIVVYTVVMFVTCMAFLIGFYADRHWLPHPYFNYPSWSYGMAVLSTFFGIFATICFVTYVLIIRQELREPPRHQANTLHPLALASHGSSMMMGSGSLSAREYKTKEANV